jgi:hypothetical protein
MSLKIPMYMAAVREHGGGGDLNDIFMPFPQPDFESRISSASHLKPNVNWQSSAESPINNKGIAFKDSMGLQPVGGTKSRNVPKQKDIVTSRCLAWTLIVALEMRVLRYCRTTRLPLLDR